MDIVGQVGLRVVPVTEGFPAGVQKIIDRAEATTKATIKPQIDAREAERGIQQIAGSIEGQIGGAWTKAAQSAAGFTAAVLTARFAVNQLISRFGGLFDQLQQAQIGFKSLLGQTAGDNLLESIRQFAKESPFATQELVNYSQQLIGVGLEAKKVVPLLTNIGDLVASKGGDTNSIGRILFTLTQIQSVGRLTGQDALQLQSALVPITKLLADYLGKSQQEVKKLQEQGKISAETVFTAIQESGSKVAGAMNASVRTIRGAQSYLSDSILITFQNSTALKGIYDDIVQGIIKFADVLSDADIQASINGFLDSIGQLYTTGKPAIEAFLGALGTTGVSSLTIFTEALETFNTVIAALPEGVLENLARGLALLAAIRAPFALIKYVQQLQTLVGVLPKLRTGLGASSAGGILGDTGTALTRTEKLTSALTRLGPAAVLAGGLIGGEAIKGIDRANKTYQSLGSTLEGVAIGFSVGGPWGAAVGGLGGLVKGLFDGAAAQSKAFKDSAVADANEVIQRAQLAASYSNNSSGTTGAGAVQAQIDALKPSRDKLATELDRQRAAFRSASSEQADLEATILRNTQSGPNYSGTTPDNLTDRQIDAMEQRADDLQRIIDTTGDATKAAAIKLEELDTALAKFVDDRQLQLSAALGNFSQRIAQDGDTFKAEARKALDKFLEGNTLLHDAGRQNESIFSVDPLLAGDYAAVSKARIDLIALTTAEKQEVFEITGLRVNANMTLEDTLAIVQAIALGEQDINKQVQTELEKRNAVVEALNKSYQAQGQVFAAFKATADLAAAQTGLSEFFSTSNLEAFRSSLRSMVTSNVEAGVSVDEITNKVNDQYAAFIKTAEAAGLTTQQTQELANVLGVLPEQVLIDISIANYDQVVSQIESLVRAVDVIDSGTANMALALDKSDAALAAGRARAQKNAGPGSGTLSDAVAKIISDADARQSAPKAAKEKAEKDPLEELAKKQEQALNGIKTAMENAANQLASVAETFKQSIKDRTQLERGISVNSAIRNSDRQSGLLAEYQSGVDRLRAMGVTDSVFKSLEIDNIQDIRQVRKLLASNPADLNRLVGSVGNRDRLADAAAVQANEAQQRKTITEAIIAAATILGLPGLTAQQAQTVIEQVNINPANPVQSASDLLSALSQAIR